MRWRGAVWALAVGVLGGLAGAAFAGEPGGHLAETPFVPGAPAPVAENADEAWAIYVYPAEYEEIVEDGNPNIIVDFTLTPRAPVYGKVAEPFVAEPEHEVGESVAARFAEREIQVEVAPAHREGAVLRDKEIAVVVAPEYEEPYWVPAVFKTEPRQFETVPERKELRKVEGDDEVDRYEVVTHPPQAVTVEVKVLEQPGRVATRKVPAKTVTLQGRELAEDGAGPRETPAVFETVKVAVLEAPARVDRRTVPAKMGSVTRMKVLEQPEPEKTVRKITRKQLKTPERVVWRKYRLTNAEATDAAP